MFKTSGKNPGKGCSEKPVTGAQPVGGYGAADAPGKAQKMSGGKKKPSGSYGSYGKCAPNKPKGGYGTRGKPTSKKPQGGQRMGSVGDDGMATPKTPIPSDQKTGRFNLPKGKFV